MLLRMSPPLRVALGLLVLTLLWHAIGSSAWIEDGGFAIWVVLVVELIAWYDRRRRRGDAGS
jgi:hypothetical protein